MDETGKTDIKNIEDILVTLDFQIETAKSLTKLLTQIEPNDDIALKDFTNTTEILYNELSKIYENYQIISDFCEQNLIKKLR